MVTLRRPSTFEEGIQQLTTALADTQPPPESQTPRAKVWRACHVLLQDGFPGGLRLLYEANAIVSMLFNTIVPHVDERMRYDTLQREYDKAHAKPAAVEQNAARFAAIIEAVAAAERESHNRHVSDEFASMRSGMAALYANDTVLTGLSVLYVSNKTARGALDLILQRLLDAFRNDSDIVQTTDIPLEAMWLR